MISDATVITRSFVAFPFPVNALFAVEGAIGTQG